MNPTSLLFRAASVVAVAFALWSLVPSRQAATYYPLTPGLAWEYEVSDGGADLLRMRVTNGSQKAIGSWRATEQRMEMGDIVASRFAVERPDMIAMVAEQRPGQTEPQILDPPSPLLMLPPAKGASWDSGTTNAAIAPGAVVSTRATIESLGDDILVPAGPFSSCVRVSSVGRISVQPSDMDGPVEIVVGTLLWYAPDVGLVQMTRTETTDRPELGELRLTYKLAKR